MNDSFFGLLALILVIVAVLTYLDAQLRADPPPPPPVVEVETVPATMCDAINEYLADGGALTQPDYRLWKSHCFRK